MSIQNPVTSGVPNEIGEPSSAIQFLGEIGHVVASDLAAPIALETFSYWLRPTSTITSSSRPQITHRFEGSGVSIEIILGSFTPSVNGEVISIVEHLPQGGFHVTSVIDTELVANRWTHVAGVWNSEIQRYDISIDGAPQVVATNARGHARLIIVDRIVLGGRLDSEPALLFSGSIDQMEFYDQALSVDDAIGLSQWNADDAQRFPTTSAESGSPSMFWSFEDGDSTDWLSSLDLDAIAPGIKATGVPQALNQYGESAAFSGDPGDIISTVFDSQSNLNGISYWLRPAITIDAASGAQVTHEFSTPTERSELVLGSYSPGLADEVLTIVEHRPSGGFWATSVTGIEIAADRWTHIAWIWNGSTNHYDAYIDGVRQQVVASTRGHAARVRADNVSMGGRATAVAALPYTGAIDEFQLFAVSPTSADVSQLSRWRGPVYAWNLGVVSSSHELAREFAELPPPIPVSESAGETFEVSLKGNINAGHFVVRPTHDVTPATPGVAIAEIETAGSRYLVTLGSWSPSVQGEILTIVELRPNGLARMSSATGVTLNAGRSYDLVLSWDDASASYQWFIDGLAMETTSNHLGHVERMTNVQSASFSTLVLRDEALSVGVEHVAFYDELSSADIASLSTTVSDAWQVYWSFEHEGPPGVLLDESADPIAIIIDSPDEETQSQVGVRHRGGVANTRSLLLNGQNSEYATAEFESIEVPGISLWFMPWESTGPSSTNRRVLAFEAANGVQFSLQLGSYSPSLQSESITLVEQLPNLFRATTVRDILWVAGQWHHVSLAWNSSESRYDFIVDGQLQQAFSNTNGHAQMATTTNVELSGGGAGFRGLVDELIIWDRVPTTAELASAADQTYADLSNVPPLATSQHVVASGKGAIGVSLYGFDADNDPVSFHLVQGGDHGDIVWTAALDAFTYVPTDDFVGTEELSIRPYDGNSFGPAFSVTLEITGVTQPALSYYVPGLGTASPEEGDLGGATLVGAALKSDVIVNGQYSRIIERIDTTGATVWRYQQPVVASSIDYQNGEVYYTTNNEIHVLNAGDGLLDRRISLPGDTGYILFANVNDDGSFLIGRRRVNGNYSVDQVDAQGGVIDSWLHGEVYAPRWADISGDRIAIADTFNHRVVIMDRDGGNRIDVPVYYPNDVRWEGNRVLITEEHGDRVWWYNTETSARELVLSGPGGRSDLTLSLSELVAVLNAASSRIDPTDPTSKSVSSTEYSGATTLYSPNGAVPFEDVYFIADTDNHRVVQVSSTGEVISVLSTFNNPTKVAVIR